MKARKVLGGLTFGLGCATAFVGVWATVLPMIQNDQLQLVLSSFAMPSDRLPINAVNGAMNYALEHGMQVMLSGISAALLGVVLLLWGSEGKRNKQKTGSYTRQPWPPKSAPQWENPPMPASAPVFEAQPNPFADFTVAEMLTPKPAPPSSAFEEPFAAYQPPPAHETAWKPIVEETPYARPKGEAPPPLPPLPEEEHEEPPKEAITQRSAPTLTEKVVLEAPVFAKPEAELLLKPEGQPSQSGARMLIRSTFTPPEETEKPAPSTPLEAPAKPLEAAAAEKAETAETADFPEASKPVFPPSRIRSTMGRHH